jgi:thiol-disulfide isomerase/thioredoxin
MKPAHASAASYVPRVASLVLATFLAACAHTGGGGSQEQVARGWIERAALDADYPIFMANYDTVQVRAPFIPMLRSVADSVETVVFLGTWCPDSKRQVPHFLKVADSAGIPSARIRLYALDRTKSSDDGMSARYTIERVPTFVFLKQGKEVGRIVEVPQLSIEEDMLTILAKAAAAP